MKVIKGSKGRNRKDVQQKEIDIGRSSLPPHSLLQSQLMEKIEKGEKKIKIIKRK